MRKRKQKNIFKFISPAKNFSEAIPGGNGETGFWLFGGAGLERIILVDNKLCFSKQHTKKIKFCKKLFENFFTKKNGHLKNTTYENNLKVENDIQENVIKTVYYEKEEEEFRNNKDYKYKNSKTRGRVKIFRSPEKLDFISVLYDVFLPDVSKSIEILKNYMKEGYYEKAENILDRELKKNNVEVGEKEVISLCDLSLKFGVASACKNYYRAVDTLTGEVEVYFEDRRGALVRNCFSDKRNNRFCFKTLCYGERLVDVQLSISSKRPYRTFIDENNIIFLSTYKNTVFGCVLSIFCTGGILEHTQESLIVKGAKRVEFCVKNFYFENLLTDIFFNKCFLDNKEKKDKTAMNKFMNILYCDNYIANFYEENFLKNVLYKKHLFGNENEKNTTKIFFYDYFIKALGNKISKIIRENKNFSFDKDFKESSLLNAEVNKGITFDLDGREIESIEDEFLKVEKGEISKSLFEKLFVWGRYLSNCFNSFALKHMSTNEGCGFLLADLQNMNLETTKKFLLRIYQNMPSYKLLAKRIFGFNDSIFIPFMEDERGFPLDFSVENLLNFVAMPRIVLVIFEYFRKSNDFQFVENYGFEICKNIGHLFVNLFELNNKTGTFESPFGVSPFSKTQNSGRKISFNCVCDFVGAKFIFLVLNKFCVLLSRIDESLFWEDLANKIPDYSIDKNGIIKEYNSNKLIYNEKSPYIPYLFPYNLGEKAFSSKRDFENLIANTAKFHFNKAIGNLGFYECMEIALTLITCGECADGFEVLSIMVSCFLNKNLTFSYLDNKGMGLSSNITNFLSLNFENGRKFKTFNLLEENSSKTTMILGNFERNVMFSLAIQKMFITNFQNNIFLFQNFPKVCERVKLYGQKIDANLSLNIEFSRRRNWAKVKIFSKIDNSINLFVPQSFKRIRGINMEKFRVQDYSFRGIELKENKPLKLKIFFSFK